MRDYASWRGLPVKLFAAGLVGTIAAGAAIRLYAPDPDFLWPATLFLLLCLPLPASVALSLMYSSILRTGQQEVVVMASITELTHNGTDDDGSTLYTATAVAVDTGEQFRLRDMTYTDAQRELVRTAELLPVGYQPGKPELTELRFDLIDLVLDRADPGAVTPPAAPA